MDIIKYTTIGIEVLIFILLMIFPLFLCINVASAQDNNTKVLFDETSPNLGTSNTINNIGTFGSSGFAILLQRNGYSTSALTDKPITSDKLKGYTVLIIMGESRNYNDDEVKAINDFVNNGGGLLLLGNNWGDIDGDQNFAWNKIARSFGVSFANNEVVTKAELPKSFINTEYIPLESTEEINNLNKSPVTANVEKFYYILGTYIKDPGSSKVIAYTDSNTWGDQGYTTPDGTTESNFEKDPNERSGPLPVVSQMEYGKGKVIFMGAASSYTNSMIYRSDIWKLGLNSVNWLSNKSIPNNYQPANLFSFNLIAFQTVGMILFTVIILSGLAFQIRRNGKSEMPSIKTIKNWKFKTLIGINAFLVFLAGILFIPINFFINNNLLFLMYDPTLGYTLIITGFSFLSIMGVILFYLIARQRLLVNYSYFNIVIILLFAGLTVILRNIFGFPMMQIFTFGSLLLIIPLAINLWFHRNYGPDLIIEGKEFNRLEKLSAKSLPYELHPFYTESIYIGEGGFGRVFKAINQKGTEVAIKIPKSFNKEFERTFITEVSNWEHLEHPNIVELYNYKILPIPYIETEFCEGSVKKGMRTLQEAVSIVYDVGKGLAYAHSKNIIHGDVKLSNILVKNGVCKISDWGLSKMKIGHSVTLLGATPAYAAPEQISRKFGKADERTDIYQLGNVFYELLTGRLPFEGDISEIYSFILTTQPLNPAEINPDAKPVGEIIMKCLSKNKEDRYSSMEELLQELTKYRQPDETILFNDKNRS